MLDEERTPLLQQEGEAGEVDLLLVRFDLREVRIHRHVQSRIRGHTVLHVQPRVRPAEPGGDMGKQLQVQPRVYSSQADQVTRLRDSQHRAVLPVDPRPVAALPPGDGHTLHVEPPHHLAAGEGQGREGDRQLGRPAAVQDGGLRPPDPVPALVVGRVSSGAVVRRLEVVLYAKGVDVEPVGVAVVVVRVEHEAHQVSWREAAVPWDDAGVDVLRIRIGHVQADVELVLRVEDPHERLVRGRNTLEGIQQHEAAGRRRQLPAGIAQVAVDHRRRAGPAGHDSPGAMDLRSGEDGLGDPRDTEDGHDVPDPHPDSSAACRPASNLKGTTLTQVITTPSRKRWA